MHERLFAVSFNRCKTNFRHLPGQPELLDLFMVCLANLTHWIAKVPLNPLTQKSSILPNSIGPLVANLAWSSWSHCTQSSNTIATRVNPGIPSNSSGHSNVNVLSSRSRGSRRLAQTNSGIAILWISDQYPSLIKALFQTYPSHLFLYVVQDRSLVERKSNQPRSQ